VSAIVPEPARSESSPDEVARRLAAALRKAAARRLAIDTQAAPVAWLHAQLRALGEERG
jgi:hypothetical protein